MGLPSSISKEIRAAMTYDDRTYRLVLNEATSGNEIGRATVLERIG